MRSQNADVRTYGTDFSRRNANVDRTEVATRLHEAIVKGCKADSEYSQIDGYPHNVEIRFNRVDVDRYENNIRFQMTCAFLSAKIT